MKPDPRRIADLTAKYNRAVEKERTKEALALLRELESLDGVEARWSQRLGDALRRSGDLREAEDAYARAVHRYAAAGFVTKAVAMAKVVSSLNPSRTDLVGQVDAEPARSRMPLPPAPALERAAPMVPNVSASHDQLAFNDAPPASRVAELGPSAPGPVGAAPATEATPSRDEVVALDDADLVVVVEDDEAKALEQAAMAACALFAGVSSAALRELGLAAELVECAAGAVIMKEGDAADALFALAEGAAVVERPSGDVRLREGDVFGEACLLGRAVRGATVRAADAAILLRITKVDLDRIVAAHADVGATLFGLLTRRLLVNALEGTPLFAAFDPATRLEIGQRFEVRRATAGTVLAEAGKRTDGLYLTLAGELEERETGALHARGVAFGHGSLLARKPSAVTLLAKTDVVLLRLPQSSFSSFAASYPPALSALAEWDADVAVVAA